MTSIGRPGGAPPFALEGTLVTINVEIENKGSSEETIGVVLHDETEDIQIGTDVVTLAGGASTVVSFVWDTQGATGGPPITQDFMPPPGSLHILTATVNLEGDSNSQNNSLSLDSPIYIIAAAPTVPMIDFSESSNRPAALFGEDLTLAIPDISTEPIPISTSFFSVVQADSDGLLGKSVYFH